jgi:uncharacterized protein YndB with AHSA1/START domain
MVIGKWIADCGPFPAAGSAMAIVTRSQVIKAPAEEVFDAIVDGGNFAAWNPTVRASRQLDSGEVGDGTRFEWDLRGFGKVIQELHEFRRPRQVRIVPRIRTLEGGHRFVLTAQGTSTLVDHELEMRPKGAFRLFASAAMGMVCSPLRWRWRLRR